MSPVPADPRARERLAETAALLALGQDTTWCDDFGEDTLVETAQRLVAIAIPAALGALAAADAVLTPPNKAWFDVYAECDSARVAELVRVAELEAAIGKVEERLLLGDTSGARAIIDRARAAVVSPPASPDPLQIASEAIAYVRKHYDESIFPPRPAGPHSEVYDGEAAAVARQTCDNVLRELHERLSND